jgi:hypothetical protein
MIKLYKKVDGVLRYHEAWEDDGTITEHWGIVGERGESREHTVPIRRSEEAVLLEVLKPALDNGYTELDEEDLKILLIEFRVDAMGSPSDLDKRHALEDRMNAKLGWTGLGHCDGGSIGSGSMEVCCMVVDTDIATRVIEDDLKNTEYADYSRIYEE